ncbi:MAG: tyrosine-type recombinase/integrase [Flavobacteriaceae bacterium]|nr:tyrosine-type recombinase/integrase [Flavobacteriaceae bacterium]
MPFKAFSDYLQIEKNYSHHTVNAYVNDLSEFSEFALNEYDQKSIDNVNYSQIRSWIVFLSESNITNRSINRKISSLKAFYRFLLKTAQIKASPLAKHRALKTSKKIEVPFSQEEMSVVLNDCFFEDTFEGVRDYLIIELFYSTGIRRSELINIKLKDIDDNNRTLRVLGKRNKERVIPLLKSVHSNLLGYLLRRKEVPGSAKNEHLFLTKKGAKIYETLVYRIINEYFSKASTKVKKSPHILRHTFATHLLNQGANLNAVKELLGHSSLASTQVYTHSSISELKKVYGESHPRSKK